jgi:hypothetical protein
MHGTYNLVHIQEGDEWKISFRTRYGHFEYVVMLIGLTNAPTVFQHMMNDVFHEYLDDFVVFYIDDILVFSNNMANHERHICFILEKLQEVGIYAKLEKCGFHQYEVVFLDFFFFKMVFTWTLVRFKPLWFGATLAFVRDVQCFLGLPNFISDLLHTIPR